MKQIVGERKDIAFYIKMNPLPMHKEAYEKSKAIVCEKSLSMLEDAFAKKQIPKPKCKTAAVDESMKLAKKLGISGAPAMVMPDGRVIAGFKEAIALNHPRWQYRIQGNYDGDGGGMVLEDAWVAWYSESGWSITAGQFKCPVLREEKVDSMFQLCVERSVVNDALSSGERLTGVAVGLAKDTWRGWLTFTDGDGFPNTPALAADTDYAVSFRGEVLLAGGFAQFDTFTSFRGEPRGVMLGLGLATQRGESGTPAPETVVYMASADLSVELGGANFLLQATWADVDLGDIDGPRGCSPPQRSSSSQ